MIENKTPAQACSVLLQEYKAPWRRWCPNAQLAKQHISASTQGSAWISDYNPAKSGKKQQYQCVAYLETIELVQHSLVHNSFQEKAVHLTLSNYRISFALHVRSTRSLAYKALQACSCFEGSFGEMKFELRLGVLLPVLSGWWIRFYYHLVLFYGAAIVSSWGSSWWCKVPIYTPASEPEFRFVFTCYRGFSFVLQQN